MKVILRFPDGKIHETVIHKPIATIGRSPLCDIPLKEESLSRQHCKIEFKNNQFYLTDLNSANGVYLDGEKAPANIKLSMEGFNKIQIGILECTLETTETPKERTSANFTAHFSVDSNTPRIELEEIPSSKQISGPRLRHKSRKPSKIEEEEASNLRIEKIVGFIIALGAAATLVFLFS